MSTQPRPFNRPVPHNNPPPQALYYPHLEKIRAELEEILKPKDKTTIEADLLGELETVPVFKPVPVSKKPSGEAVEELQGIPMKKRTDNPGDNAVVEASISSDEGEAAKADKVAVDAFASTDEEALDQRRASKPTEADLFGEFEEAQGARHPTQVTDTTSDEAVAKAVASSDVDVEKYLRGSFFVDAKSTDEDIDPAIIDLFLNDVRTSVNVA